MTWFWSTLAGWDDEMQAAVLRFVTGTSKVPIDGFAQLRGGEGALLPPRLSFTVCEV